MSGMLEGLLSLARIQRAELHPIPLELAGMARHIVNQLQAAEPARPIEVAITGGIAVEADSTLLTGALEALLQNAWKFTRGREPARIEVGIQPGTPPIYFVRDNGVGFDMRYADKLFSPFQRLHSEREFEGVGIGLATARRIVRRHGGRIWAEAGPTAARPFISRCDEPPSLLQPTGHFAENYILYAPQHAQFSLDVRFSRFGVRAR